jgi:hypothetical protein
MARRPPRGFASWSSYNAWRVRRGIERGLSPSQSMGRPRVGEVRASEVEQRVRVLSPEGPVWTTVTGVAEKSRAGRYDNEAQQLLRGEGEIDIPTFNRRWAGKRLGDITLPNAARVLRLGREGLATFEDFYPDRDVA